MIDIFITKNHINREKIISEYLASKGLPTSVDYTDKGAPIIAGGYISISHTDDIIAIALSRDTKMGIDIERADRKIKVLPSIEQWTQYEAYAKWTQQGLTKKLLKEQLDMTKILTKSICDSKYILSIYADNLSKISYILL